jgi:uncharacterized membrane protein
MKKIITTFMMMALMAVAIPMLATSTEAQTRYRTRRAYTTTTQRPNFYKRHRNLINIGIGTAAGALLGGLIGGKKGALIGTAAGAGGAALYSYKLNPKTRAYERVYRY